jgi:hypothetical protein
LKAPPGRIPIAAGSALVALVARVGFQRRANHHAQRHQQLESSYERAKDNIAAVRSGSKSVAQGFADLDKLQEQLRRLPEMP